MIKKPIVVLTYEDREEWIKRTKENKILSRFLAKEEEIQIIVDEITKNFDTKLFQYPQKTYSEICSYINNNENIIFWNLTDGFDLFIGSHIPSFATILEKPYIGSSTYTQALCQNKHHLKTLAKEFNIMTPEWIYFDKNSSNDWSKIQDIKPPYFIKPANFDNSIGTEYITPIANNLTEAKEKILKLFDNGITKVLLEKFVGGEEITLACLHLDEWKLFPLKQSYNGKYISSYSKEGHQGFIYSQKYIDNKNIIEIGKTIINTFNIKDYCRIDFRYDENGNINLLEVNTGTFLTTRPFTTVSTIFFNGERSKMFLELINYSNQRQI